MKSWILFGVIWGLLMCSIMTIAYPLWDKQELNPLKIILSIPVYITVGSIAGYFSMKKKPENKTED